MDQVDRGENLMTESASRPGPDQSEAAASAQADDQPPFRYDARLANEIERHWQEYWRAEGTFNTPNPSGPLSEGFDQVAARPKFYVMDMFPYPSGAGLHVGHPLGYIGTDVYARYLRMTGHNVLHPFGYDAFGLPAEQYALDTGQHPAITTQNNIATMRRQLRRLGLGHDDRREFATTDVSYYKWTQWIFLQIFNSWFDTEAAAAPGRSRSWSPNSSREQRAPAVGEANPDSQPWAELTERQRREVVDGYRLAYISEELVNWCPGLGTVLANEEITADGRSDIGNYPVYRRPLRQWMLRITAYAERLLDDLDLLDWPESIKTMQRNWIGPSHGASIEFPVARSQAKIRVYTTRPDTLAGATYMVLAPEHPLVDELTAGAAWPEGTPQQWRYPEAGRGAAADWTPAAAVRAYRDASARLTDRQRVRGGLREDRRLHRLLRGQPDDRRADTGIHRRLRADGLRHRRDHGRPRARRARLRVRAEVRPAGPGGAAAARRLVRPSMRSARTRRPPSGRRRTSATTATWT